MTVTELHKQLTELVNEGKGDFEVFDMNAFPIISAHTSDDDIENELNRVYIESEF